MTEKDGNGIYRQEIVALDAGWTPRLDGPPSLDPDFLLVIAPPISAGRQWSIRVRPDGTMAKPEGMTEAEAIVIAMVLSNHNVFNSVNDGATGWLRDTMEKWTPWQMQAHWQVDNTLAPIFEKPAVMAAIDKAVKDTAERDDEVKAAETQKPQE